MELTVPNVHRLIGKILGANAVSLQSHIHKVSPVPGLAGVAIASTGELLYDPDWWSFHIDNPEKAKHAIAFELVRKMLGINERTADPLRRVATGMVINAYLYNKHKLHQLPRAMYSAVEPPECLMRPNSRGFHSRLKKIYNSVWKGQKELSVADVTRALRIIFNCPGLEGIDTKVEVFGYINDQEELVIDGETYRLPEKVLEEIAEGVVEAEVSGYSLDKNSYVTKKMKSRKTLETKLVEQSAIDRVKKSVTRRLGEPEPFYSSAPTRLSRRDAIHLAMGRDIHIFESEIPKKTGGLAAYIDVSGSFERAIPYVLGVMEAVSGYLDGVYQFSNTVHEMTISEIRRNKVKVVTTGGTDFNCVVRHAVKKKFNKILLFTDGAADIWDKECQELAEKHIDQIVTIIVQHIPQGSGNATAPGTYLGISPTARLENYLENTWMGKQYGKPYLLRNVYR